MGLMIKKGGVIYCNNTQITLKKLCDQYRELEHDLEEAKYKIACQKAVIDYFEENTELTTKTS
jgi:hypothetical protein